MSDAMNPLDGRGERRRTGRNGEGSGERLPLICAETREQFAVYEDGELEGTPRERFEEHIHRCRSCSKALAEFEHVTMRLIEAMEPCEPSASFTAEVMDRVRSLAALEEPEIPTEGFTRGLMQKLLHEELGDSGVQDAGEGRARDDSAGGRDSAANGATLGGGLPGGDAPRTSPQPSLARDSRDLGSVAEGSVAEGSVAEGSVAEGSVAEGSVAEGSVAEGSVAEGRAEPTGGRAKAGGTAIAKRSEDELSARLSDGLLQEPARLALRRRRRIKQFAALAAAGLVTLLLILLGGGKGPDPLRSRGMDWALSGLGAGDSVLVQPLAEEDASSSSTSSNKSGLAYRNSGPARPLALSTAIPIPSRIEWSGVETEILGFLATRNGDSNLADRDISALRDLPGSTVLELGARGKLLLTKERELVLRSGEIEVDRKADGRTEGGETKALPLVFRLGQGYRVEVAAGQISIAVQELSYEDEVRLFLGTTLDRVSVRVWSGSAWLIEESSGQRTQLESGQLALLEPLQALRILRFGEGNPDGMGVANSRTQVGGARSSAQDLVVRGFVRGPQGEGLEDVALSLHVGSRTRIGRSGKGGAYELRIPFGNASSVPAWVEARSGSTHPGIASLTQSRIGQFYRPEQLQHDITLLRKQGVHGRLLAAGGKPVVGARLRLLRYDSLLDSASFMENSESSSGAGGSFFLSEWPKLEKGEALALIVEAKGEPLFASYALAAAEKGQQLEIRLPPTQEVQLELQDSRSRLVWLERRPSGVAGRYLASVERIPVEAGAPAPRVRVETARRAVWWEDLATGQPAAMHAAVVRADTRIARADTMEQLRVVSAEGLASLPRRFRIVRASDRMPVRSGRLSSDGLATLDLPIERSLLRVEFLDPERGWISYEIPRGGNKGALRLGGGLAVRSSSTAQVPAPRLTDVSGSTRAGAAPPVFGEEAGASRSERTALRLRLVDAGSVVPGAQIFVRIGEGAPFLAGWSDLDGRLELPALPEAAELRILAYDAGAIVQRIGFVKLDAESLHGDRSLELGPLALVSGLAPARRDLGSAQEERVELEIIDGPFQGFRKTVSLDAERRFVFSNVPPGTLRVRGPGFQRRVDLAGRSRVDLGRLR